MCISLQLRVAKINQGVATMEDGRIVRIGLLKGVEVGDCVEVYADIAIAKKDNKISKGRTV